MWSELDFSSSSWQNPKDNYISISGFSARQGFPGRRILRRRLSTTCLGRTKEKHVRPPGLEKLCECENKQPKIIILTCSSLILLLFFYRRSLTFVWFPWSIYRTRIKSISFCDQQSPKSSLVIAWKFFYLRKRPRDFPNAVNASKFPFVSIQAHSEHHSEFLVFFFSSEKAERCSECIQAITVTYENNRFNDFSLHSFGSYIQYFFYL